MERMMLGLSTLKDLDSGKADVAFRKELEKVARDILDRQGEKAARSVTLKVILKPIIPENGDVESVFVEFEIDSKMPVRRTAPREALAVTTRGQMVFSALFADDEEEQPLSDEQRPARPR